MYAFNNYLLNTKTELSLRRNSESVCGSVAQQSPTLYDPTNYSPPGSSVRGIFHERILERVAIPSSRGSSQPKNQTHIFYVSCIGRQILYQLAPFGKSTHSQQQQFARHYADCISSHSRYCPYSTVKETDLAYFFNGSAWVSGT